MLLFELLISLRLHGVSSLGLMWRLSCLLRKLESMVLFGLKIVLFWPMLPVEISLGFSVSLSDSSLDPLIDLRETGLRP